ncbi:MAG: hypothetical protein HXY25_06025 [Alphaproteobacteria bacterium]|nr:hypothetical protein [Alphaproteobacteria bacterium]
MAQRSIVRLLAAGLCLWAAPVQAAEVLTRTSALHDPARGGREVGVTVYAPADPEGTLKIVLMSHGGTGNASGEVRAFRPQGKALAEAGFLAIALGHRPSASNAQHRLDRPADVSFVLDSLEGGTLPLPDGFSAPLDLDHVGHAGHSWGAYTANAVGGARFDHGEFRDPRIAAIMPMSPQGPDQFGSFDRGPDDNSWMSVLVPAYLIVGGEEMDGPPAGFRMTGWRAQGFHRYPADGRRFLTVIQGQDHGDIGGGAEPDVIAHMVANTVLFFDIYLRGAPADPCLIGSLAPIAISRTERSLPTGVVPAAESCAAD